MAVFTGPPVVLLSSGAPLTASATNVVTIQVGLQGGPAGVLVPLFTGTEPAEQFVQSLGEQGKGMTPLPLDGFETLEGLLVELQKDGTTHVTLNADLSNPNPIPIDEVIDSLRRRP